MEFTVVDAGVGVIALISAILAYSRGLTREVLAIGGWLIAAGVAAFLTPAVEPLVLTIPVVGEFLQTSCVLSVAVAFVAVMALGLLFMAVFVPLISNAILDSALGGVDRILGFVFGIARAALIVVVAFMLYDSLRGTQEEWEPLANAASRPFIIEAATRVQEALPTQLPPWLGERIDAIMAPCGGTGVEGAPRVDENGIELPPGQDS